MTESWTYNSIGTPTALEYVKTSNCSSNCTWFYDTLTPSIHGQWLEQSSPLSHQVYSYDAAGRLVQVQNTPAGKHCTTRAYGYDSDTNRLTLSSREAPTAGGCTLEGATTESHSYDEADRLQDTGASYNPFGDVASLPAGDAGGSELKNEYFVDDQLASQTQGSETVGYALDPAGRNLEVISTGPKTETVTNHYAGPQAVPAWTVNLAGETKRDITGLNGQLAAIQTNVEAPVLQIANLHGDIVGTASLSETATGLLGSADTSEFGVPTVSAPAKYSWLGAIQLPTAELPASTVGMGARSYEPYLGRFLQPDHVPNGSANAYSYTFGDPLSTTDPSGEFSVGIDKFDEEHAAERANAAAEAYEAEVRRLAEEAAARAAAEWAAQQAAANAALYGPQYGEEWGEEEWEGEEEPWWFEEAAYHGHASSAQPALVEEGLFFPESGRGGETPVCPETSGSTHAQPCVGGASIFSKAWGFVKHVAKGAANKFVKVVHYIINVREKATTGFAPYGPSSTASGCEVVGFLTTFGSPFVSVGAKVSFLVGATIWASC